MTANRVGSGGLPAAAGAGSLGLGLEPTVILDLCDGILGEVGRRMHRFSWLPDPSAPIVSYLPLDAYYPGNRIVVVLGPRTSEQERLCREQVPAHGLNLLFLESDDLNGDPRAASQTLRERFQALGPVPDRPYERVYRQPTPSSYRPPPSPAYTPRSTAPPGQSAQASGSRSAQPASTRSTPPGPPPKTPHTAGEAAAMAAHAAAAAATHAARPEPRPFNEAEERAGIIFGMSLALLLGAEALVGVVILALGNQHYLLAIGLAFDVCARGLGTVAAVRDGSNDSAWGCLIFGSPAVVSFALLGDDPIQTEPAPLAGALGAFALGLCGLWLLGAILGI